MSLIADSQTAETESGDTQSGPDSEFEPWLRQAARAPNIHVTRLPLPGQVVGGKYRIEAALGAGGMGAVFRATHLVSEKPVALKWMLRPASDEIALQRLTREARAAGRIDHPNVVDVYDIGHEDGASYLVMELLHGESLRKQLARARLEPRQVVDLLLPAMYGVAAAHRVGVVHRDLKPDNIFLCEAHDGEPRRTKVVDFGISTIVSTELSKQTALTGEGTLLGTPAYLAPEQVEGGADADFRIDIYAFGVILYEALTGRVPFKSDSYLGLAFAIAKSEPIEPRALRPEIPIALQRVVLQALRKDRNERPQTMDALINTLLPFASAFTPGTQATDLAHATGAQPAASARRSRAVALLAAGLVVSAAAGLWWTTRPTPKERALPTPVARAWQNAAHATARAPALDPAPREPPPTAAEARAPSSGAVLAPETSRPARASGPKRASLPQKPLVAGDSAPPWRPRAGAIRSDEL